MIEGRMKLTMDPQTIGMLAAIVGGEVVGDGIKILPDARRPRLTITIPEARIGPPTYEVDGGEPSIEFQFWTDLYPLVEEA